MNSRRGFAIRAASFFGLLATPVPSLGQTKSTFPVKYSCSTEEINTDSENKYHYRKNFQAFQNGILTEDFEATPLRDSFESHILSMEYSRAIYAQSISAINSDALRRVGSAKSYMVVSEKKKKREAGGSAAVTFATLEFYGYFHTYGQKLTTVRIDFRTSSGPLTARVGNNNNPTGSEIITLSNGEKVWQNSASISSLPIPSFQGIIGGTIEVRLTDIASGALLVTYFFTPNLPRQLMAPAENNVKSLLGATINVNQRGPVNYRYSNGVKCMGFADCYLTTAASDTIGLGDKCWELRTLRKFRDEVMVKHDALRPLVAEYYAIAPRIVDSINLRGDAIKIWLRTYWFGIIPSAICAQFGLNKMALWFYRKMTKELSLLADI